MFPFDAIVGKMAKFRQWQLPKPCLHFGGLWFLVPPFHCISTASHCPFMTFTALQQSFHCLHLAFHTSLAQGATLCSSAQRPSATSMIIYSRTSQSRPPGRLASGLQSHCRLRLLNPSGWHPLLLPPANASGAPLQPLARCAHVV